MKCEVMAKRSLMIARRSHELFILAGSGNNRQLVCRAQAMRVIEPLAVILCHAVVGACIMAVASIDLIAGTYWLTAIRKSDRGKW